MLDLDAAYLSTEHRLFRSELRKFVDNEVREHAVEWDEAGRVPESVVAKMGELGFLGASTSETLGGSGLGAFGTIVFGEEIGRSSSGGFAAVVSTHADIVTPLIGRIASDEIKAEVFPDLMAGRSICALGVTEPSGGSDLIRMETKAILDGDAYVLNGQKTFITNAHLAEWFAVAAKSDPDAPGAKGFTLFLIRKNTPGLKVGAKFQKTGWAASDMSDVFFEDCRVPVRQVLGEAGKGFYHMMSGIEHERLSIAAQSIGMAERAVEVTLSWLKSREAYRGVLWDLQAIRHDMSRAVSELCAAKALVYQTAAALDRGESVRFETTAVKALVPEVLKRTVDKCVQFHGAHGYMRESEIERIWRDTRPYSLGGGASEVMLDEMAKLL